MFNYDKWQGMNGWEKLGYLLGYLIGQTLKYFLFAVILCAVARYMFGF